ncbi:response regulator transcription factor [Amycolatopsis sp. H20-H5]|uniref:response regulator transcription factor n=1 Tax=Amycolatopsis sp. H20-H5 TaxID=3046309 RepID=UPI002DBCE491|nr:response regulator transcription factor [Amycolatopsis sp. H20-H5]MEC3976891.1 response regulator transcription factor [Amycolatopsis sp. H20-H5]
MYSSAQARFEAEPLHVAVLVGSELLRRGLEGLLQSLPSVGEVHRCESGEEAAGLDFLIVSTLDTSWLAVAGPGGPKVLVLVDESAMGDPSACAALPADGFLSQQNLSADTLNDALRRCAAGELPMPATLARALLARADGPEQRHRNRPVHLTSREIETLSLLVRGLSNKQIARRLTISSHGAKRLVASIMLKLDSPNRTTAVVNAIKAGLVDEL